MKAKFDEISANIQKVREAIRLIRSANPTSIVEDEVFPMAVGKHLSKRIGMFHDARCHAEWRLHLG